MICTVIGKIEIRFGLVWTTYWLKTGEFRDMKQSAPLGRKKPKTMDKSLHL